MPIANDIRQYSIILPELIFLSLPPYGTIASYIAEFYHIKVTGKGRPGQKIKMDSSATAKALLHPFTPLVA